MNKTKKLLSVLLAVIIGGNFGAPEMGIRGAALATLISRSVELLIILVYIFVFIS